MTHRPRIKMAIRVFKLFDKQNKVWDFFHKMLSMMFLGLRLKCLIIFTLRGIFALNLILLNVHLSLSEVFPRIFLQLKRQSVTFPHGLNWAFLFDLIQYLIAVNLTCARLMTGSYWVVWTTSLKHKELQWVYFACTTIDRFLICIGLRGATKSLFDYFTAPVTKQYYHRQKSVKCTILTGDVYLIRLPGICVIYVI